jgi:hypothetical protein
MFVLDRLFHKLQDKAKALSHIFSALKVPRVTDLGLHVR